MTLDELMEKRRADLEAAIALAAPHKFTPELLIMYRGWGSDVADYFLESVSAVLDANEQLNVARKIATEKLGHGIPKVQGVPGQQQRRLDKLAVAAIEEGFDARLAQRRG